MRGRTPDLLVVLVAASILALGLYVSTLPQFVIVAPGGTEIAASSSEAPAKLTFAVRGEGGRLVGSFTSTYETSPWIHPSSYTGIPRGPLGGICAGSFDNVFPPGEYTITFFGGPGTVRIAQAIEVLPARAPEGASQYGTFANGMACPRALNR